MRFASFKGEKTINDLVSRLFNIKGPGSSAAQKQAASSLIAANPQLKDLAAVPVGTVLSVPDLPHPVNLAELTPPPAVLLSQPGALALDRLGALRQTVAAVAATGTSDANATIALVQNPDVQAAAAQNPALAQLLPQIAQQAQADLQEIQTEQALYDQAIAQMQQILAKFGT
ncbi:MAG TPA: hypothetical protein VGS20_08585 [Candidatus Acidoferrales bacterium]|nr:hypothetical protein [Candidatus Acidoferrales bacterium]